MFRRFVFGVAPLVIALGLRMPGAFAQTETDPVGADAQVIQPIDSPGAVVDSPAVVESPATTVARAGLVGSVSTSGRCPVPIGGLGRGQTCLDRPFPTTLLIRGADPQQPVTSLPTASDGTFSIALPPGHYSVDPLLADGNPPEQSSIAVDVTGESITQLTIRVSGGTAVRVP